MKEEEKKAEELTQIKSFLNEFDSTLIKKIKPSEQPDVIFHTDSKKIGIEHTRIIQPDTPDGLRIKREEAMRDRVLQESEKIFRKSSDVEIHVDISYDSFYWLDYPQEEWGSQEYHELPQRTAAFVLKNLPSKGENIQLIRPDDGFIRKYIGFMTIFHFEGAKNVNWSRPRGGAIPYIQHDVINQIIDDKNKKAEEYDSSCNEFWLLMIKNDFDYSMSVELTQDVKEHKYVSKFQKLFIFDIVTLELIELKVA